MTQISFSVLQDLDVSRMIFLDKSVYTSKPVAPTLHIKFPDFKKIYSTTIEFGVVNVLNTQRVGYTECLGEFPDGIYELEYEIGNRNCTEKQIIFRTTKAWSLVDKMLQGEDYENNKDLLERFNKINLYLRGAESVVKINQYQAQQLYKQAMSIINCSPNSNVQLFKKSCSNCG